MHSHESAVVRTPCTHCGRSYARTREWQRFCGPSCRDAYHRDRRRVALRLLRERDAAAANTP